MTAERWTKDGRNFAHIIVTDDGTVQCDYEVFVSLLRAAGFARTYEAHETVPKVDTTIEARLPADIRNQARRMLDED